MNNDLEQRVAELETQMAGLISGTSIGYETLNSINARNPQILMGSATIDLPDLSPGSNTSATIGVSGARVGDVAIVGIPSSVVGAADANRLYLASVTSDDVVTFWLTNTSAGGSFNVPSAVFTAVVIRRNIWQ